jgi:hypothetical protein
MTQSIDEHNAVDGVFRPAWIDTDNGAFKWKRSLCKLSSAD